MISDLFSGMGIVVLLTIVSWLCVALVALFYRKEQ